MPSLDQDFLQSTEGVITILAFFGIGIPLWGAIWHFFGAPAMSGPHLLLVYDELDQRIQRGLWFAIMNPPLRKGWQKWLGVRRTKAEGVVINLRVYNCETGEMLFGLYEAQETMLRNQEIPVNDDQCFQ